MHTSPHYTYLHGPVIQAQEDIIVSKKGYASILAVSLEAPGPQSAVDEPTL